MKRIALLFTLIGLGASLALAQSEAKDKQAQQMKCPMMGAIPNTPMAEMMKGMSERMGGMFALSSEEVAKVLAHNKTALSLSDAQVKALADLMASSQQQKVREKMQGMMQMCPCMQSAKK